MKYKNCVQDILDVCARYNAELADKPTEKNINSNIKTILSYYKLMYKDEYVNEAASVKLLVGDNGVYNISLTFSPLLEKAYSGQ